MERESINEPVDVLAAFSQGRVYPRQVRWNGRVYQVTRIHSRWTHREGEQLEHHFSVRVDQADLFQLCLELPSLRWRLEFVRPG